MAQNKIAFCLASLVVILAFAFVTLYCHRKLGPPSKPRL